MAIIYIDPTANSGGDGSFASPYVTFPTPTANNTYLLKSGSTYNGSFTVGVGVTNVTLGSYDEVTGNQITDGSKRGKINGAGTTLTVRWRETAHNGTIESIEVYGSDTGSQVWALYLGNTASAVANNMTVKNCYIHSISSDKTGDSGAIKLNGSNALIENCFISGVPTDGIFIQGNNNKIKKCTIINVDQDGRAFGDNIQFTGNATLSCSNFLVENCWLDHSQTATKQCINAQDTTGGSNGGVFKNNICFIKTSVNTPNQGIYLDVANSVVSGNYIVGGTYNIYVASDNCLVYSNICLQGLYGIYQESTTSGGTIFNNLISESSTSAIFCANNATLQIKNNIIQKSNIGISKDGGATEDYNCYYLNTTNQVNLSGSASWGSNNMLANPMLTSTYTLKSTSPLISAGSFIGYYRDTKKQVFLNPPSIGAYEYIVERAVR